MKTTLSLFLILFSGLALAAPYNGFNIDNALINPSEIRAGGPPKDGIPAIDLPNYISVKQASWLKPDDRIIGVAMNGEARAYPIRILNWHEIVNTSFGDTPIVVTFCPLCGTGMVFKADAETLDISASDLEIKEDLLSAGKSSQLKFGVSGLLYNSDVLLYDRNTESLWSQIMSQAISGPLKGSRLELINSQHTTYRQWLDDHPNTKILDKNTGFNRNYDRNPYSGYEKSDQTMFAVDMVFPRKYHPKDEVLGIQYKGKYLSVPFRELSKSGKEVIQYQWQGTNWIFEWHAEGPSARVKAEDGTEYPSVRSFIFAWYAFHPETDEYELKAGSLD